MAPKGRSIWSTSVRVPIQTTDKAAGMASALPLAAIENWAPTSPATPTLSPMPRILNRGVTRPHQSVEQDVESVSSQSMSGIQITAFELFSLLLSLFVVLFLLLWLSASLLNLWIHHIHTHRHRNPTYEWLSRTSTHVGDRYRRASRTLQNFSLGSRRQSRMSKALNEVPDEEEDISRTRPPSYATQESGSGRGKASIVSLRFGQERPIDFGDSGNEIAKSTSNIWRNNFAFGDNEREETRRRSVYWDS